MNDNELGKRLKKLRVAKAKELGRRKIPQREVAAYLNISPGAYGSWESGRNRPDISLLPKVADYFGVSIDYLLGRVANVQVRPEPIVTKTTLAWSLRRAPQTDGEQKGIEAWTRLTQGQNLKTIMAALQVRFLQEMECYLHDAVYADMISIDHVPQNTDLAERVRQTFKLRDVVVVPTLIEEQPLGFKAILLGEAARSFFKAHVHRGMKVGIAGGYSVSRLVYSLRRGECRAIEVYPLTISPVTEAISLDANTLVGVFAYFHHGYDVRGYALPYATHLNWKGTEKAEFLPTLRILTKAKSVDIAFMGLGIVGRRRSPIDWLSDVLEFRGLDLESICARGAIGDILHHLIDQDGQPIAPEISDLVCSLTLSNLREMVRLGVRVVAIASGERKVKIARAAIKAGYVNVIIMDEELAQALLEAERQSS